MGYWGRDAVGGFGKNILFYVHIFSLKDKPMRAKGVSL
jgi:hypothetical protein